MLALAFFQTANFILAALMYTIIGRFLLGLFLGPDSPNFIMRFFRTVTDPAVRIVAVVTPVSVSRGVTLAFTLVWAYFARIALFLLFAAMGAFQAAG